MSPITSNLTYAAAIVKQAENCVNCFSLFTQDSVLLKDKLRIIDTKLAKLADAFEVVGVSNTLANRLAILKQEKADSEMALERVPAPVTFLPDVLPTLVQRWRELVFSIGQLADNPATTLEDIEVARANLRVLLGTVPTVPRRIRLT